MTSVRFFYEHPLTNIKVQQRINRWPTPCMHKFYCAVQLGPSQNSCSSQNNICHMPLVRTDGPDIFSFSSSSFCVALQCFYVLCLEWVYLFVRWLIVSNCLRRLSQILIFRWGSPPLHMNLCVCSQKFPATLQTSS